MRAGSARREILAVFVVGALGLAASPGRAEPAGETAEAAPSWAIFGGPPRLGLRIMPMTAELRSFFGGPPERGVLVVRVDAQSPAATAGIRVGDVVLAIDGVAVAEPYALRWAAATAAAGARLDLGLLRDKSRLELEVALRGEPNPLLSGDTWREFRDSLHPGIQQGGAELRKHLEDLESRLRDLEQQMQDEGP